MFIRLACILLLALSAVAGDFLARWPDGKTEKLYFEVTTFVPVEMKASTSMEITKSGGAQPTFTINQIFDIPAQQIKIKSVEKYRGNGLRFESANNSFKFPEEAKTQLGTDTVHLTAIAVGDSIEINSNAPKLAPAGKIAHTENLSTSVGAILASRDFDFKIGAVKKYNEVDFLTFNGMPFHPTEDIDSVMGEQEITVPAGTFACYKLISQDPLAISYTYFTKDERRMPVMLEIYRAADTLQVVKMVLQKYE
jgi:hypothetical protein